MGEKLSRRSRRRIKRQAGLDVSHETEPGRIVFLWVDGAAEPLVELLPVLLAILAEVAVEHGSPGRVAPAPFAVQTRISPIGTFSP